MRIKILFYNKTFGLADLKPAREQPPTAYPHKVRRGVERKKHSFARAVRLLQTLELSEWNLAIDSGDYAWNGKYFMLNYYPLFKNHIQINFSGQNFLFFVLQVQPWKLITAFFR